jgi:hypothetical protein
MRHHRRHAVAHSRHHQHRANEGSLLSTRALAFNIFRGDSDENSFIQPIDSEKLRRINKAKN